MLDILERYSNLFEFYPSGKISGLKIASVLEIAKILGYDAHAILMLIPFLEEGLLAALKEMDDKKSDIE